MNKKRPKLPRKEDELRPRSLRIGVIGAMASGKSTLAFLLGEKWGATIIEEQFQDNPFLTSFYDNPAKLGICFNTQMSFLGLKAKQMGHRGIDQTSSSQVQIFDPSIEMDSLYAQVQAEMGLMEHNEHNTYNLVYEAIRKDAIIPIDFFIIVDAPSEILLDRILDIRKRQFEHPEFFSNFPDYLPRLVDATRRWKTETASENPNIVIDTAHNNFVDSPGKRKKVEVKIESEIRKFLDFSSHSNEKLGVPVGKDGAPIIIPDFIKI